MHDGAAIISEGKIKAVRCILPVSNREDIPAHYGLRHRSAIGLTEITDSIVLIVSEETGEISYIKDGEFVLFKDIEELITKLQKHLAE